MPVSHEHEVILVHIPKTGGTSIEAAFNMHGSVADVGIVPYKRQKRDFHHLFGAGLQHMTIAEIERFFVTGSFEDYSELGHVKRLIDFFRRSVNRPNGHGNRDKFERYLKFAVVRNPYDRLVSGFAWLDGNWHKEVQPGKDDFSRYIERILSKRLFEKEVHLIPQYQFVELRGRIGVDKILHLEDLDNEFNRLCTEIGLDLELPKRMVSKHKKTEDYFDEHSRDLVYDIYEKDFEMFGYEK